MSSATPSMEKLKPAKKRCKRLYFESVLAFPGIATAILARFTVRIFINVNIKQDSRSALALFHLRFELKISVSFAILFMKFTSFMTKSS
jgi:hypothetical protein